MADDKPLTATECQESTARALPEIAKMIGPRLDELNSRLLGPVIDRTFKTLLGAKLSDDNHKDK